jgi:ABC-type branched-subunit amino acid transport system substrate-binding protein
MKEKKISPSGDEVLISVVAPLSGEYKRFGIQSLEGLKATKKIFPYLKNGDKIVFDIIDTKSTPDGLIDALNLALRKSPKLIISFEVSNNMLKAKDKISNIKIPIIVTLATANEITKLSNNIYQVCMDNKTQTLVAAHYIIDEKFIDNVAVLYNKKSDYSKALAHEFKDYFINLGGNITYFKDLPTNDKKFLSANMNNVKFIYLVADARDSIEFIKQVKKDANGINILGSDGLLNYALYENPDIAYLLDGVFVVEHYAKNEKRNKKLSKLKKYLGDFKFKDSSYTLLAYDGYKLMFDSLNICIDSNDECIKVIMQNSDVIEGIYENFSMINAKAKREVYVDKIKDAKLYKEIITY